MEWDILLERVDSKKIIILINPWHPKKNLYSEIIHKIPNEFGYISYHYSTDIINSNPSLVKEYMDDLINKIVSDMKSLDEVKKRKFYIYAESLGTGPAIMVADKIRVEKVVLVAPGYSMADGFWFGRLTKPYKEEMEKKGVTLKQLERLWKDISADNSFKNFAKEARYLIKLAENDETVPFEHGLKLVNLMKQKKVRFSLDIEPIPKNTKKKQNPHTLAVLYDCLFPEESLEFLTGQKIK